MHSGVVTAIGNEYKTLIRTYLHLNHIKFSEAKAGWRTSQFPFEGTDSQCLDVLDYVEQFPNID